LAYLYNGEYNEAKILYDKYKSIANEKQMLGCTIFLKDIENIQKNKSIKPLRKKDLEAIQKDLEKYCNKGKKTDSSK
ncbi:MAG: hypothetical protein ACOVQA_10580, partial [Thermoflexibacteraceae bacterium]